MSRYVVSPLFINNLYTIPSLSYDQRLEHYLLFYLCKEGKTSNVDSNVSDESDLDSVTLDKKYDVLIN